MLEELAGREPEDGDLSFSERWLGLLENTDVDSSLRQHLEDLDLEARRKTQAASALVSVARAVNATLDVPSVLKTIGEQATQLLRADRCAVLLLEDDGCTLTPSYATACEWQTAADGEKRRIAVAEDRIWRFALRLRKVMALDRVVTQLVDNLGDGPEARSVMVAPLVAKDKALGVLYADVTSQDRVWTDEDREMAAGLADLAALAIDNARVYQTVRQKIAQVEVINQVAQSISFSLSIRELVDKIALHIGTVVQFDRCSVILINKKMNYYRSIPVIVPPDSKVRGRTTGIPRNSAPAWVATARKPLINRDLAVEGSFDEDNALVQDGIRSRIVLPLISNNEVVGTLNFGSCKPGAYTERDLDLLLPIAGQIAPAIETARLFEMETRRNKELAALHAVAAAVSESLEFKDLANGCLDAIAGVFVCGGMSLVAWDSALEAPLMGVFRGLCQRPALRESCSTCWRMIQQGVRKADLVVNNDAARQACFAGPAGPDDEVKGRPYIGLPLKHKEDILGYCCLIGAPRGYWSQEDISLLQAICSQIGTGIERARLYAEVNRRASEFGALYELSKNVSSTLDSRMILRTVVDSARALLRSDISFLCLIPPEENELHIVTETGIETEQMRGLTVKIGEHMQTFRVPMVVEDISSTYGTEDETARVMAAEGLVSMLSVPLLTENRLLGVLHVANRRRTVFSQEDVLLLSAFGNQAAMAIHNARLHEEVKQLAVVDGLTSLFNHRYFYQRLNEEFDRATRFGRPLALIFMDVDNLKLINDRHGHLEGDAVLRELGVLLKQLIRSSDIVARYGGDELALILPETNAEQAAQIAQRLQDSLDKRAFSGNLDSKVTVSMGVAALDSEMSNAVDLVWHADQAAYDAKLQGKGRMCVFRRDTAG